MALPRAGRGAYRGRLDDDTLEFPLHSDDTTLASIRTPMRRAAIGLAILAAACALPLGADAAPRRGTVLVATSVDAAAGAARVPAPGLRGRPVRIAR